MAQEAVQAALTDARLNYKEVNYWIRKVFKHFDELPDELSLNHCWQVQQGVVGYVYGKSRLVFLSFIPVFLHGFAGDSTCGQRALYTSGLTGIPIYNVNNNCATGLRIFIIHHLIPSLINF